MQRRLWRERLAGLILPAAIFGLWELASHRAWVPAVFLPTPEKTALAFVDMVRNEGFQDDLLSSLAIVAESFACGTILGLAVGLLAGLSRTADRVLGPTLDAVRHVPPVAWLPLIVLWAGIGPLGKLVFIVKVVFFPVFLSTMQGIRAVSKEHLELAQVLTLTRWQLIRRVILPGAMPSILTGLRYGASLAWALIVVAEGLSGLKGIGFLIFRAQALLMTDQLLVCMVVIGTIGFLIDRGMRQIERHVLRWRPAHAG